MKTTRTRMGILAALASVVCVVGSCQLYAQSTAASSATAKWNLLVDRVSPGDTNIEPAFQAAIYENLVEQLVKTKRFNQVFRSGDRKASEASDLLILKTTVQEFNPGSETRRAVTTFAGATKLRVNNQLCTKDGGVIFESLVDGNVRFVGGNLRATQNLARHVAKQLKNATLPNSSSEKRNEPSSSAAAVQATHIWQSPDLENLPDGSATAAMELEK